MANRNWVAEKGGLEKGRIALFLKVPIGATGAVGTLATKKGITSVTRTGVGAYTIVLDDKYVSDLAIAAWVQGTGSSGTPAAGTSGITCIVHSVVTGSGTNQFKIQVLQNNSTAGEIDNGWTLVISIEMKDSLV